MTEQIFARRASGLVAAFRARDLFVFNSLGFAFGLVASLMPSFLALQQPKADIVATLTVGLGVCLLNGLLYAVMAGAIPRSGGDYVFVSRVISPSVGFSANWGLTWSQFFGLGAYAAWAVSSALGPGLVVLGRVHHSAGIETFGQWIVASPIAVGATALALLVSCAAISLAGMVLLRRVLLIGFSVALAGTFVSLVAMLNTTPNQAYEALDALLRSGGAVGIQDLLGVFRAQNAADPSGTSWWSAVLALPVGYWAYLGFTYSVYVGHEVTQPRRSQFVGILGSLVFGYVGYVVLLGRYYEVFGRETIAAFAFAEKHTPELLPVGNVFMLAVGATSGTGFLAWLATLSYFLWFVLLLAVMMQVCVRNVFAWSLDGIVPARLAEVVGKRSVPRNAIVLVSLVGSTFAVFVAYGLINFVNYVALFVVCYLVTGIAALLLPWRRPDLLELIVGRWAGPWGGVLMAVLGGSNALAFTFILGAALFSTDFGGVPATIWPSVFLGGVYVSGYVVYRWAERRTPSLDRELRVVLPPQ